MEGSGKSESGDWASGSEKKYSETGVKYPAHRVKDLNFSFNKQEEIEGRERRRLRLVIAIPALMILITLTGGIISYEVIIDLADRTENLNLKSQLESAGNLILLANLVACAVALVFGVGLATYIIRPIRAITAEAMRIARGDISGSIQISNPDEIGELGESFNSLVNHLQSLFKERNRYILEGFSEGIVSIDYSREINSVNSQSEKILGYSADEMIGKNFIRIIESMDGNSVFYDHLRKCIQSGERITLDNVRFTNRKGTNYHLSVTTSPIKDKRGRSMGTIITMRDLALLAGFTKQIQKADRLATIGSFATGIAHELRNPLGSIKGVAQLLGENPQQQKLENYTDLIIKEVNRLDKVIRTILDFAQPEPENPVPFDINSLLDKALEQAIKHPSVADYADKINIHKEFGDVRACTVQPERLIQAFSNIIINALQSLENEQGHLSVKTMMIAGENDHSRLRVEIADDGPPIPGENLTKIFEPFFTTRRFGTGLGLPISYQIIVFNNGALDVKSDEESTVFMIDFPVSDEESSEKEPGAGNLNE